MKVLHFVGKYILAPLSLVAMFVGGLMLVLDFTTEDGESGFGGLTIGLALLIGGLVVLGYLMSVGPRHFQESKTRYLLEAFFWSFL